MNVKAFAVASAAFVCLISLSSCGSLMTKDELVRYASRTYGDCNLIGYKESEDSREVTVKDKLQGFEYGVSSYYYDMDIDGSNFGFYPTKSDTFEENLKYYVWQNVEYDIDRLCDSNDMTRVMDSSYDKNLGVFYVTVDDKKASEREIIIDNAKIVIEKAAAVMNEYNKNNRLDGMRIDLSVNDSDKCVSEHIGSVLLPGLKFRDIEEENIDYYTDMAKMQCTKDIEFLRIERKTFRDTGADLSEVCNILGSDRPESEDDPVVFYYFKDLKTGKEFYLCDFNYPNRNKAGMSWYTDYPDGNLNGK